MNLHDAYAATHVTAAGGARGSAAPDEVEEGFILAPRGVLVPGGMLSPSKASSYSGCKHKVAVLPTAIVNEQSNM